MNNDELFSAIKKIELALNASHNTVTTDLLGVEPDETHWRIDYSKELESIKEIKSQFTNTGIYPLCKNQSISL